MEKNVLVIHGGGPTAVLNASLYGAVLAARESGEISHVYGAIGGSEAILKEDFLDLMQVPEEDLKRLLVTPGTAIGSSRYALSDEDYAKMPEIFGRWNIRYVLPTGGNGTMDTCGKIQKACENTGIRVVGIPKTIDNDIAVTDHTPGYGSAARYLAETVAEIGADVKSLPIHVCIVEAMGRNAGWITAASALAREKKGDAPHLIYLPERPFREEEFLEDVRRLHEKLGGVVVVASEGLKKENGEPIVPPLFRSGRSVYYGDVGAYLAELVIRKLGIKARSEKPGICGRASIPLQSAVDREEAVLAGRTAFEAAHSGQTGVMVSFVREDRADGSYRMHPGTVPIQEVMMYERKVPDSYINTRGNDVTDAFVSWCRPLADIKHREFIDFQESYWERKGKSE
ncbi:diphosphate--fructose-6-phosphate 1-phosphotransferase [Brotaphodocola sp.]|uniref:diphosphate--fructose-6-phosphate 1-phosphotransferase n=1 Tax=Brotaphodocola sp. TaxID=3073577 RepID=UPI003D7D702D